MEYSDTTVVIPAKDEPAVGETIDKVLAALPGCNVIVVYLGSPPKIKQQDGVSLLEQKSKGYGAALKEGFRAVNTPVVGMIDADGSYEPMDLQKVVALVRNGADMAVGNRLTKENGKSMDTYIKIGNTLASMTYRVLHGVGLHDTQCGLRAMKKSMLDKLQLNENGWLLPPELNAKVANRRFKIVDTPITYYARVGTSKLEGKFSYGFKLLAKTIEFRFKD